MEKLQQPSHVFMNGDLRPWQEAVVHVSSEGLLRSASVFEGIKGYWETDSEVFNLLAVEAHYERLARSARLMHLPFEMTLAEFTEGCSRLARQLLVPGRDLWLRPTLFAVEGHWGLNTVTDLVITGYTLPQERPAPIAVGISTWRRGSDRVLSARIKSPANYQSGRLARIEGRRRGYAEMLLLNGAERIAEATGSCLLMVRDGTVVTPPVSEGCLESITVDIIERLCREEGIPFERRPLECTELYLADEAFLAGTLAELVPVRCVEDEPLPDRAPVLDHLSDLFWETVRATRKYPDIVLTEVERSL